MTAWGSGAEWVLDQLPRMLGADDDPSGFVPVHEPIALAWRRHANWRLGATDLVMESLVPAIIEQKVTGQEAFGAFRALVHRFGERAPGPPERGGSAGAAVGAAVPDGPAGDPVLGVVAAAGRRRALAPDPARGPGRHRARASRAGDARGVRPAAAHAPGHRGVDQRRGAFARARRRRRGELRRLPRRRQHRLRADRGAGGRRRARRAPRAVRRTPAPGPAPGGAVPSAQTASTVPEWLRGGTFPASVCPPKGATRVRSHRPVRRHAGRRAGEYFRTADVTEITDPTLPCSTSAACCGSRGRRCSRWRSARSRPARPRASSATPRSR